LEEHTEEMSGFLSRIVQHECDHLEGAVFIDHISAIRKQLIRSKLSNLVEGKTRVSYPVKYAPRHRK
jgi:peptide deformylase